MHVARSARAHDADEDLAGRLSRPSTPGPQASPAPEEAVQEERVPAYELAYGYRRGPCCWSRSQIVQVALHFSSLMRQAGRRMGQSARAIDTAHVPLSGHWRVWRRRRRRRRPRAARPRPRSRLRRSGCRQSLSRVQHTMTRRRRRRTWRAARPRGTMTTEAGPARLIWSRLQPAAEAPRLLVLGSSARPRG